MSELETLLGDGAPDSPTGETGTRRKLIEGFKDEAKRFRAGFSDGGDLVRVRGQNLPRVLEGLQDFFFFRSGSGFS